MTTPDFFEQIADAVAKRLKADTTPQSAPLERRLLSAGKAARYLDCSLPTLSNLVTRGVVSVVYLPGTEGVKRKRQWFDVRDLDRAIEENKHNAA